MNIENIKKEMLEYRDFFGGDIPDIEEIKSSNTKEELSKIVEKHRSFMEDMLCDAHSHLDNFKQRIGL